MRKYEEINQLIESETGIRNTFDNASEFESFEESIKGLAGSLAGGLVGGAVASVGIGMSSLALSVAGALGVTAGGVIISSGIVSMGIYALIKKFKQDAVIADAKKVGVSDEGIQNIIRLYKERTKESSEKLKKTIIMIAEKKKKMGIK